MKHARLARIALCATALLGAAAAPAAPLVPRVLVAPGPQDVRDRVAQIVALRDEAKPESIAELADLGTREAALGLIEVYDAMGSLYMQREVLRALARFDGIPEAEQPALEKVASIATEGRDAELRRWAVDALAGARHLGKSFLVRIVESPGDDEIREYAMECHVQLAGSGDESWYRALWKPEPEPEKKQRAGKAPETEVKKPRPLGSIKRLAFEALAAKLSVEELVEAASSGDPKVRVLALEQLGARKAEEAYALAEERYGRVDERDEVRVAAAQILAQRVDSKLLDRFVEDGMKGNTPRLLSFALADLFAQAGDEEALAKLAKKVGKGDASEKLFVLRALAETEDPKLAKSIQKLLLDKDVEVRIAAAQYLAHHEVAEAVEDFAKQLAKFDDDLTVTAALQALNAIRKDDPAWQTELRGYLDGEAVVTRNAAIKALGATGDTQFVPLLIGKLEHPDWSTRLAAARALEGLRAKEAVGPLIGRVGLETGLMRTRIVEVLFRMTGQVFGNNERAWQAWWDKSSADFELITAGELARIQAEEDARRLRQVSRTAFFGIKIESRRLIFIIDVSGSMNELTRGTYVGEDGPPRMDVAKRELARVLDELEPGTLFNILAFSDGVGTWIDGDIAQSDSVSRDEAKEFVERLGAGGGTNLYGALDLAFEDPDVDTIYVLSDGEPSLGTVTDQATIREHVALWNENRGIVIHSIAVGGNFSILEWLAEDSGGTHVKFP